MQGEIENALRKLGWKETRIVGAGRTDSGVHAAGQVFSATLQWKHGTKALIAALNANLPDDIAIRNVELAKNDFHARFDAKSRTYHYHIYHSATPDPLLDPFSWRIWPELDLENLNKAAQMLIGEHDFCAFGSPPRKNGTTVRNLIESYWVEKNDSEKVYVITANAFLYHMVRRVVFLQIFLVTGLITWEDWRNAIELGFETKPGMAPAHGLRLYSVSYQ